MTPDLLLITSSCQDGVLTFHISGQLDYDSSGQFTRYVEGALAVNRCAKTVTVDCTNLTGVDSAGLSALLSLRRRTDTAGAVLVLERRPRRLNRMLEITGTLDYLTRGNEYTAAARGGDEGNEAGHTSEQLHTTAAARTVSETEH
ncbi:STAS domain-containing protein [Streptomyces sp. SID8379]|uniref:STAS domain-containing protein n=1 Tax=unclassified Streptomyces TaxID=2593676 RepID=UPI0003649216|nr:MULTISPECIES: STAS domain-containing protein [unclassified Streptomyces]MYW70212.1 STAS domain-containing protein [Streptomyces sp. SID8379]